ncbi:transcription factor bHLH95-like [Gossypium arboreum]|nr:transcription factor bHLH95-like [Gossypium arboreum]
MIVFWTHQNSVFVLCLPPFKRLLSLSSSSSRLPLIPLSLSTYLAIIMSEEGRHESFLLWEKNHQSRPLSISDNNNNSPGLGSEDKSATHNNNQQQEDNSQAETKKKKKGSESDDEHDMHIWTERERRKKMRNMFSNLHALLPHLPPKADKSTIVDEAVNYIKTLQQTLQNLEKKKLERSIQGAINVGYHPSLAMNTQNQTLEYSSREAFLADQVSSSSTDLANNNNATKISSSFSMSTQSRPVTFETWTSSNLVLNVCGNEAQKTVCSPKKPGLLATIYYILKKHKMEVVSAQVSSFCKHSMFMIQACANEASKQSVETFQVEDMFKQAVGEIMCWVSS